MTNNEIISKWRGECRHKMAFYQDKKKEIIVCECGDIFQGDSATRNWHMHLEAKIGSGASESGVLTRLDYELNPAAWDERLYGEIGKELIREFIRNLRNICYNVSEDNMLYSFYMKDFALVCSTPAQKAEALARAIESEG